MYNGDWSISHDAGDRERLVEERELAGRLGSPDYSIELPRHIPLDAFDEHSEHSHFHETFSTAAHHASALTLSAGLAPRFASPHASDDAEFDPARLQNIPTDISLFNITRTPRSAKGERFPKPAVLDPHAELDRVARAGRFSTRHARETDDALSDVSTVARSRSDIENAPLSPRLAEALGRQTAAFSPKRPRTQPITAMPIVTSTPSYQQNRPPQRVPSNASKTASTPTAHDDSNGQDESKFERMARGFASDLQRAKQDVLRPQPQARAPFADVGNNQQTPRPARRAHTPGRQRVHLPDVTGITAAVASPMRAVDSYYDADADDAAGPDAQAVSNAIEELAARLGELEQENGAARRRVRELEMELDECRAEVARERTRVLDAEVRERKEREKGKARAAANEQRASSSNIWETRYREVVEEKKNLETLVTQLRAQLARMTRELESHQAAIRELRSMHERDAQEMRVKVAEIEDLRAEVDHLSDEVERLRDIIDDHLRQRREAHSNSDAASVRSADIEPQGLSAVVEEPTNEMREEESMRRRERERAQSRSSVLREVSHDNEWFHRTDGATAGSERPPRFIEPNEVSRIEEELDERRTERSMQSSRHRSFQDTRSLPSSRSQTPVMPERPVPTKASSAPAPVPPRPATAPTRAPSRRGSRQDPRREEPQAQMPADLSIGGERLQRMFSAAPEHDERTCHVCHRRRRAPGGEGRFHSAPPDVPLAWQPPQHDMDDEGFAEEHAAPAADRRPTDQLPPQTVLARVLRELEDDFTHYKGLYIDLADQYKLMDAASNVVKRNVVAEQLKEVIDVLEQKGDHIAALYDLLKFGDKHVLAENGWGVAPGDRLRARRR